MPASIPIGTRCIVNGLKRDVEFNGVIVVVLRESFWDEETLLLMQHAITDGGGKEDVFSYPVECLYPIEDDEGKLSNADTVVKWEDCVWQPSEVTVEQHTPA